MLKRYLNIKISYDEMATSVVILFWKQKVQEAILNEGFKGFKVT